MGPTMVAAVGHAAPSFNPLLAMIIIPAIGSVLVAVMPARRSAVVRQLAITAAMLSGALSVYLMAVFHAGDGGLRYEVHAEWVKSLGISFHLGVDGISLFLLVLTGLLFPVVLFMVDPPKDSRQYYMWMLLLMAGSMGVFVALDLVVFFLFFEIVLVPMYFLIAMWGHGDRIYAATKFFLFTMFGSAFLLVAIVVTAYLHQKGSGGGWTFDVVTIARDQSISKGAARWLFAAFAIAFAVKVPLFPLHTWLPDAHGEAPTGGSVILAGLLLKFGTYGFLRFGLFLFPEASHFFAPLFLTLGVIGILYGAICAAMQKDLKRVIAFSSVAHLGFIALGTFSFTIQGIEGGVVQMINHGITTSALFLLVGIIYDRRHTRAIAELSGLQRKAPVLAGAFTLAMMASIGLPGLNGFVGEFLALIGAFKGARWWGVIAASGVILAALYLLWAYQRVFHGPVTGDNETMTDMRLRERLSIAPLLALIVFLGVYPKPMLDRIEPSVRVLVQHVVQHDPTVDGRDIAPPPNAAAPKEGR